MVVNAGGFRRAVRLSLHVRAGGRTTRLAEAGYCRIRSSCRAVAGTSPIKGADDEPYSADSRPLCDHSVPKVPSLSKAPYPPLALNTFLCAATLSTDRRKVNPFASVSRAWGGIRATHTLQHALPTLHQTIHQGKGRSPYRSFVKEASVQKRNFLRV